jgi:hypothetical protein
MSIFIIIGGAALVFFVWQLFRRAAARRAEPGALSDRWLLEQRRSDDQ